MLVIGNVPSPGVNLYDIFTRPVRPGKKNDWKQYLSTHLNPDVETFNIKLSEALAGYPDILFINPVDYLCTEEKLKMCENFDLDNNVLYSDGGHLSIYGSQYLIRAIEDVILTQLEIRLD